MECRLIEFRILCILGSAWSSKNVAPIQLPASLVMGALHHGTLLGPGVEACFLLPVSRAWFFRSHSCEYSDHLNECWPHQHTFISGAGSSASFRQCWVETGGLYDICHFSGPGLTYIQYQWAPPKIVWIWSVSLGTLESRD